MSPMIDVHDGLLPEILIVESDPEVAALQGLIALRLGEVAARGRHELVGGAVSGSLRVGHAPHRLCRC